MSSKVYWHASAVPAGERILVTARSGSFVVDAHIAPAEALKLIEELTNALEELDIEVVRIERKRT